MRKIPSWYLAFGVVNVALGIFSQPLPLYTYFLGAKAGQVGLLSAVGSATAIIASLFWGKLADLTPHRPLVLLGLLGLALGYAILPFLTTVAALFPLNAGVTFLWLSAGTVSTLLVLAALPHTRWEKELGLFNAVFGVGWTVGLLVGSVWTMAVARLAGPGWALRSLGLFAAFVALAAGIIGLRFVPETTSVCAPQAFTDLLWPWEHSWPSSGGMALCIFWGR